MLAEGKQPTSRMNYKDLGRVVAVLGVRTAGRLTRTANIKPVRLRDMNVLFGIFGNPGTNDREILLGIRTGSSSVDKSIAARHEVSVPDDPGFQISSPRNDVAFGCIRSQYTIALWEGFLHGGLAETRRNSGGPR
jgi:hypothetical protein